VRDFQAQSSNSFLLSPFYSSYLLPFPSLHHFICIFTQFYLPQHTSPFKTTSSRSQFILHFSVCVYVCVCVCVCVGVCVREREREWEMNKKTEWTLVAFYPSFFFLRWCLAHTLSLSLFKSLSLSFVPHSFPLLHCKGLALGKKGQMECSDNLFCNFSLKTFDYVFCFDVKSSKNYVISLGKGSKNLWR